MVYCLYVLSDLSGILESTPQRKGHMFGDHNNVCYNLDSKMNPKLQTSGILPMSSFTSRKNSFYDIDVRIYK